MSVSVNTSNNNAYLYLQSLLQQGPQLSAGWAGSSDPISQLLGETTSQTSNVASAPSAATSGSGGTPQPFGPETLTALISLQMNGSTAGSGNSSQSLFSQFDTDGDGSISQSEFDSKFASADQSQANALFTALDSNGDGSISQSELASAQQAQQSHGHHHHHHHMGGAGGAGQSQGGSPFDMLSSTDATGAQSQTTNNADGSTSTTITYADGSTVSMTTPAASGGASSSNAVSNNLLEQLIQMQAQLVTPAASQSLATV